MGSSRAEITSLRAIYFLVSLLQGHDDVIHIPGGNNSHQLSFSLITCNGNFR